MLKNIHLWLPSYLSRRPPAAVPPTHVFFCFVDHYEPLWNKASRHQGLERVEYWFENYPRMADSIRDADGRPPQHTFFYPAEEYVPEYLDLLARLCGRGYGEVEVHLHHDNDTAENLKATLNDFKVTNARVEQGTSQQVVIQFSDPLNEKQNLEGLISIVGIGTLDFEIKDNEIRVFPPVRQIGSHQLTIEEGVLNVLNYKMKKGSSFDLTFEQLVPATRFTGKGNILPSSDGLILPFEAVNLKSVNVQVIKIFENNILQFLQMNDLAGGQELRRVGTPVLNKKISLENSGVTDLGKWNRFTLDLAKLISTEPGAIYQVRIKFRKADAAYVCDSNDTDTDDTTELTQEDNNDDAIGDAFRHDTGRLFHIAPEINRLLISAIGERDGYQTYS